MSKRRVAIKREFVKDLRESLKETRDNIKNLKRKLPKMEVSEIEDAYWDAISPIIGGSSSFMYQNRNDLQKILQHEQAKPYRIFNVLQKDLAQLGLKIQREPLTKETIRPFIRMLGTFHPRFGIILLMMDMLEKGDYTYGKTYGMSQITITPENARTIGNLIGVPWTKIDINEFQQGVTVEMEHGSKLGSQTNITHDSLIEAARIALAHLYELPDYYTRLAKMEAEGKQQLKAVKYASYQQWRKKVDNFLVAAIGIGADDMGDFMWKDAFNDELTPKEAAITFLEEQMSMGDIPRNLANPAIDRIERMRSKALVKGVKAMKYTPKGQLESLRRKVAMWLAKKHDVPSQEEFSVAVDQFDDLVKNLRDTIRKNPQFKRNIMDARKNLKAAYKKYYFDAGTIFQHNKDLREMAHMYMKIVLGNLNKAIAEYNRIKA